MSTYLSAILARSHSPELPTESFLRRRVRGVSDEHGGLTDSQFSGPGEPVCIKLANALDDEERIRKTYVG